HTLLTCSGFLGILVRKREHRLTTCVPTPFEGTETNIHNPLALHSDGPSLPTRVYAPCPVFPGRLRGWGPASPIHRASFGSLRGYGYACGTRGKTGGRGCSSPARRMDVRPTVRGRRHGL